MQDGLIKKNKGLKENGGLVISKFQEGHLQPIAQGISRDQAFALTTNDAKPAPSPSSISNDIASGVATLIDRISNSIPSISNYSKTDILGQASLAKAVGMTREELSTALITQQNTSILPENNIRPSTPSPNQSLSTNTNVTVDNSPVVAAVNRLTEALMSNNNKEITITMNGEVVGKTLVNIMTPGVIRETNLISQPA